MDNLANSELTDGQFLAEVREWVDGGGSFRSYARSKGYSESSAYRRLRYSGFKVSRKYVLERCSENGY